MLEDHRSEDGTATWIKSGGRWLYARVHSPSTGGTHGGVVLVGSLAREQVIAFRALRVLAVRLALAGYVVVRPELTGLSESGPLDPADDPTEIWTQDVDACARYLRDELRQEVVHGVGLRIGAALLAQSREVDGHRIYWEPISGKKWLRRQSVLRTVSVDIPTVDDPGLTEVPGGVYAADQAAAINRLSQPEPDDRSSVYMEPNPSDAMRLHSTVTLFARVPDESIDRLVASLPRAATPSPLPEWTPRQQVEHTDPVTGHRCLETIVAIGPHQLAGVVTSPTGDALSRESSTPLSIVFAPGSAEPKDGPTALWVQIAREAAVSGHHSLRVDRRGCGDMGDPAALRDPSPYLPTSVEDFVEAGRFMAVRCGHPVMAIGFCSGSWLIMRAALSGVYDEMIGVAQGAWRRGARYYERMAAEVLVAMTDAPGPAEVDDAASEYDTSRVIRAKHWLRRHLPYALWRQVGRTDRATCPELILAETIPHCSVTLLFGDSDYELFRLERGEESLEHLRSRGMEARIKLLGPLDHALLAHRGRIAVRDQLLDRLCAPERADVG